MALNRIISSEALGNKRSLTSEQPSNFWHNIGVYPDVVRSSNDGKNYERRALQTLGKLPLANLRLLCGLLGVNYEKDEQQEKLASYLLGSEAKSILQLLTEFSRKSGIGQAIDEEYEAFFSEPDQAQHLASLIEHGISTSRLRFVTKLILLYSSSPSSIQRIHIRRLWRTRSTDAEFRTDVPLTEERISGIVDHASSIAAVLGSQSREREIEFIDSFEIDGETIIVFRRAFEPSNRPDLRDGYKTIHGFGWLAVAVEQEGHRIEFKGGNSELPDALEGWFHSDTDIKVRRSEHDVFSDHDLNVLELKLLGKIERDSKLSIIKVAFTRSLTPSHVSLTIDSPFENHPIHTDLQWLHEQGLLRIRSLSDIKSIRLCFGSEKFDVDVEVERRGATVLRFKNANLSPLQAKEIREEFRRTFGVPLNERIDPKLSAMGIVPVLRYIFEASFREQLADYQRQTLDKQVEDGLIEMVSEERRVCKSIICKNRLLPIEVADECPHCQSRPNSESVTLLKHMHSGIRKTVKKCLEAATPRKMRLRPSTLEGNDYYLLGSETRLDDAIRIHICEQPSRRLLNLLEQSMQPVLVVHVTGSHTIPVVDSNGVAHVGLAYAIASQLDSVCKTEFAEDMRRTIEELLRRGHERVLRASNAGRANLVAFPNGYTPNQYERDCFALIRSLFPYSESWGGASRPDGFCSMVYFDNGKLSEPKKFNWSYDAKWNENGEGYPLGAAEKRKACDYVCGLVNQPELQANQNELNAHVFVSNNIKRETMKSTAEFAMREHRLGTDHSDIRVVFMMQEFLLTLYDRVQSLENAEFQRRWPLLTRRVAHCMRNRNPDGYVHLEKDDANAICDWVIRQSLIETPVNIEILSESLNETVNGS